MTAVDIFVLFAACASTFVTVVCSIIHGQFFSVIPTMIQYLFMLPTFMNIFIIYSFCNVHDVTWGTRDSNLINNEEAQKRMEVSLIFLRVVIVGIRSSDLLWSFSGLQPILYMLVLF